VRSRKTPACRIVTERVEERRAAIPERRTGSGPGRIPGKVEAELDAGIADDRRLEAQVASGQPEARRPLLDDHLAGSRKIQADVTLVPGARAGLALDHSPVAGADVACDLEPFVREDVSAATPAAGGAEQGEDALSHAGSTMHVVCYA